MRIYRGSDADIVLRPFMIKLSEIVSFDLQLWTTGTYVIKRSTTESGMTIDKINNIVNVHLTDKETSYLDAGVLNAKMMYRITDSEYPDGTYDGIITIPQEYYMMTPPEYSGGTVGDIYESGYTEGYNTAIQNSVLSINGEKGDLNLKTINGNGLLGEGDIKIEGGGGSTGVQYFYLSEDTKKEAYDEIANHWDDNSGYTGDCIFCYKKPNGGVYTFTEIGYLKGHSVYFSWLNNEGAYSIGDGKVKCFAIIIWYNAGDPSMNTYEQHCTIPTKVSELTNDSGFQTKADVDAAIKSGSVQSSEISNIKVLSQLEYDDLTEKDPNTLYCIKN